MDTQVMQEIFQRFPEAIKLFLDNVNWLFVVAHMLLAKIGLSMIKSFWSDSHKKFYSLYVLLFGLLLAILFSWAFDITDKSSIMKLIFAIMISMAIYQMGPKWLFNKAENQIKKPIKKIDHERV